MGDKDGVGYTDFMEAMGHHTRKYDDNGYVDTLVTEAPGEEAQPLAVADRIKSIRLEKGLSPADVAQRAGLGTGVIEGIENGELTPPLGTMIKLAKALEMRMGTLLTEAGARDYAVVKAGERKSFARHATEKSARKGYAYQHLAFDKAGRHMEPFLVTLSPDAEDEEDFSTHDGQEFIFVLSGRMKARVGDREEILHPGDSIYYESTVPHVVSCDSPEPATILAVLYDES